MLPWLRHHLRPLSWIVWLAIQGFVWVPTLSHALTMSGDGSWREVCTPQGTRLVWSDEATAEPAGAPWSSWAHCPWCALDTLTPLATNANLAGLVPVAVRSLPARGTANTRSAHGWSTPPAQAPPRLG